MHATSTLPIRVKSHRLFPCPGPRRGPRYMVAAGLDQLCVRCCSSLRFAPHLWRLYWIYAGQPLWHLHGSEEEVFWWPMLLHMKALYVKEHQVFDNI